MRDTPEGLEHQFSLGAAATASADAPAPWHTPRVYLDVVITRRKRFHLICIGSAEPVWRDRLMSGCLQWLRAEGYKTYYLCTDETEFLMQVEHEGPTQEPDPWPK